MAITLFGAISIGSYEVEMKIFELAPSKGMREIDNVRHRLELGKETYTKGIISVELVEELCTVLNDFQRIIRGYKSDAFKVCATSAIRETKNKILLLDYIEKRTGVKIEVLGNSEQRLLDYKSIASKEAEFARIIQKGTAIIDVGGGSIQISLFDKDTLVTTQNIRIGNMRIREKLSGMEGSVIHLENLIEELINNEVTSFKKLYLKEREIKNVIVVGDYILEIAGKSSLTREEFMRIFEEMVHKTPEEIAEKYDIPSENASLILPSMMIYKRFLEEVAAETIWMPGIHIGDGIAYDYALKNKIIKSAHNFDGDIIAAARNIAKRYQCSKNHIKILEELALGIFDKMKKLHKMSLRDRLLLQIAVILHSCGKYISLSNAGDCSYNIIMSTEIIGLSDQEREIIANVVLYNTEELNYLERGNDNTFIHDRDYLRVAKLSGILRVVNVLDRSHKQKFKGAIITLREGELIITAVTQEDITLEKGLFPERARFFEQVFNVRPEIRQKRQI